MTPERWKKIEDVFQSALDFETSSEREAFLRSKCSGDDELRTEVEKLIARYETEEEFLESPVWTDSQLLGKTFKSRMARSLEEEIAESAGAKSFLGQKIGVYLLTEQIGKGGMGVVYAAERVDGEFSQKVAIKLIKRGMDTDFIVRRFRHERQILAKLNHPNIARLLDGGTTQDGSPYFIMEFIEGEQFLKYAERERPDLRQKLELFRQVCAAVIYAHKRKIIHRDIKPSNILITDEGIPKLLDFGIAKLLDTDAIHESISSTATAMRLMTPEYASPEQVRGEAVTPVSDQYSLGVLLYELLTGERPYQFPSRAPHEIARVICEEIPSEPSSGSFGKINARNGEFLFDEDSCKKLDRIVLKTLRKDPAERYASVEEFAGDIERFLHKETILAESFSGCEDEIEFPAPAEKVKETVDSPIVQTHKNATTAFRAEKPVSPRRKGIKQGFFTVVLSVLLIPLFLLAALTRILPPTLIAFVFLATFFGGFIRIIYALFFESGKIVIQQDEFSPEFEAETQNINSLAPHETIVGNHITAERTAESEKSIAVLPFQNLNPAFGETTGGSEFLSVGLADALITRLSNVKQLLVRPTSSVLRFRTEETDTVAVGEELKVEFVLTGNILRADRKIRVSIQLLDVEKGATVWAERFNEEFKDVLDIEDSITAKVVESLLPRLTGDTQKQLEKRGTSNPKAYEAFLRGRFHWNTFTEVGLRESIGYYNEAIRLDPNYAAAHAAIADYYVWLGMYSLMPVEEFYPPAKKSAERAIEIDPNSSEAYAALGLAELYGRFDWQTSEKNIRRAIELNPNNAVAHLWFTHNLYTLGKFDEGNIHLNQALELDPLSFQNHNTRAWGYYFERQNGKALAKADDLIKKFPTASHSYFAKSAFLRFIGRTEESLKISYRALEFSGDALFAFYGHAAALAAAGKHKEAIEIIENTPPSTYHSAYHTAIVYCFLKDKEKAFEMLEKAVAVHESTLVWLAIEPSLDFLRDDPQFQKILKKINHPLVGKNVSGSQKKDPEQKSEPVSNKNNQTDESKRGLFGVLKFLFAMVGFGFIGFILYTIIAHTTYDASTSPVPPGELWKNVFTSSMRAKRLTTTGKAHLPALSPDGSKIAYISDEVGSQESLWVRSVDTEDARQLIPPDQGYFTDLKFSPDGEYIYYIVKRSPKRTLYRIRVTGDAAEKVSENAYYMFAFSPDGRHLVYDYLNPDNNQRGLFIAELNEKSLIKSAEMLFVLELPNFFPGGVSFSPDGKKIAYSRSNIEGNKQVVNLFCYHLENRRNEKIGDRDFDDISTVEWRANGEEIVISASESDSSPHQLWLIGYPSGEVSRLTNDFTDYQHVGLSADSSLLVTTKTESVSAIWAGNLTANQKRELPLKQITSGLDRRDGLNGVNWTKDGRILYAAGAETERNISIMNADGTNNQIVPTGAYNPTLPALTSDNRFLVYADLKDREVNIWRFDMTTRSIEKLNSRYAVTPAISPDNRSVVFAMLPAADSNRLVVHGKSLEDGGEGRNLTSGLSVRPVISPDGRFVACNYDGEETGNIWQIAILPFNGNDGPRFINAYAAGFFRNPQTRPLAWSPDGQFLYFLNYKDNVNNIFRAAVAGNKPPVQITRFTSGEIFDFSVTPDGQGIAISRGSVSSDIIIYKSVN